MNDGPNNTNKRSGSAACRAMASSVLDDFTEQLIEMVTRSEAGITTADIRNFLIGYKDGRLKSDQTIYAKQYQSCLTLQEQEIFDGSRREPFRKIIVMHIGKLFPPEGQLSANGKYLSRRLLKGLFSTLEKMTGAEGGNAGKQACIDTIDNLKKTGNGKFNWEDVYKTPAVMTAVDDLLMGMIPHMGNVHKRALWIQTMINNDLSPVDDFDFEGPAVNNWELDERGTFMLLRELFSGFKPRLKDKESAGRLIQRYGKEQVQELIAVLTSLDKAEV
ncbi:MAG: hypothetical protein OEL50_05060 [Rhodospirillaceae bacterium]|nr:hypothetical protein [Rhodospirillaceae bacterium]